VTSVKNGWWITAAGSADPQSWRYRRTQAEEKAKPKKEDEK